MPSVGSHRHTIEIQQRRTTRDNLGVPEGWDTIKRLKARVNTPRVSETYGQGRAMPLEIWTFRTRFVRGITSEMRVKYGDEFYDIDNAINVDGKSVWTDIVARRPQSAQFGRA